MAEGKPIKEKDKLVVLALLSALSMSYNADVDITIRVAYIRSRLWQCLDQIARTELDEELGRFIEAQVMEYNFGS